MQYNTPINSKEIHIFTNAIKEYKFIVFGLFKDA